MIEFLQLDKNPFIVRSVGISQGQTIKTIGSTTSPHEHQAVRTQEVNNTRRLSREKRPYRRVTNGQRLEFANLFRQHGDDKPAEWYSQEVGIRLARTRDLLTLLRNGKSRPISQCNFVGESRWSVSLATKAVVFNDSERL